MVRVVRVRVRQDFGIGHGIEQAEAKDLGRRPPTHRGRDRGNGLAIDAERRMQCGRDMVLVDEPASRCELVALTGARRNDRVESARVALDLVAGPAGRWILVTFTAPDRIKNRPETRLRREHAVEYHTTAVESCAFRARQAAQRISGFGGTLARGRGADRHDRAYPARHGVDSTPRSMRPTRSIT